MNELTCRIAALATYPVKSCAGVTLPSALLLATGLEHDRQWMVVDVEGRFVTQRELPRLALIRSELRHDAVVLHADGMLPLRLSLAHAPGAPSTRVQVWGDLVRADDLGDLAAQWLQDFMQHPLRLVRMHAQEQRESDSRWCGGASAPYAFADAFALLVCSHSSLAELNRRLLAAGHAAVSMQRFCPNIVLDGLEAHDEDHVRLLRLGGGEDGVSLQLVKPCVRCTIPDVDPHTARTGHAVADTLASYRSDARVNGGATFGMNAIVVEGAGRTLNVGMAGHASLEF